MEEEEEEAEGVKNPFNFAISFLCSVYPPRFRAEKKFLSFLSKFKEFSFSIGSGKEGALQEEEEEEKGRESLVSVVSFPLNLPEIRCKRTGSRIPVLVSTMFICLKLPFWVEQALFFISY